MNNNSNTGFHLVNVNDKINIIKYFLENTDINYKISNNNSNTGFHLACIYNNLEIIKYVIEKLILNILLKKLILKYWISFSIYT